MQYCPCGTGKDYLDCCGIFISGQESASTPEKLMRSRYTAYTQVNIDYIVKTMKSPAADNFDSEAARTWTEKFNWTQLEIIKTINSATQGFVEFRAYYYLNDKRYVLHEISEFNFEDGKWYYINGKQLKNFDSIEKIGRNDLCPCGSNKKYKKCCGHA
jgi:SEC-C motif domain protein